MRITTRFIGVLAAVLLIAVPAMGISAQGGASVPSPVIVETGAGGEIQTMVEGLLYEGSGYVPGMVASVPPSALPVTGGGWELQAMVEGLLYKGSGYVPDVVTFATPEALPPSGTDRTGLTEFEWQLRLNEMIAGGVWGANAGLGRTASGSPKALPQTGTSPSEPPYYEALPAFLASASTSGKAGQDTQTILDGIAGGVRNITEILPEELAAAGR